VGPFPAQNDAVNFIANSLRLTSALGGKNFVCRALPRLPEFITGFETIVTYRGLRFRVHTGEETGRRMFYYNRYEHLQEDVFLDLLRPNALVFDIGANMGLFSLLAASRGAQVISFEPSRLLASRFQENVELNGVANIRLIAEAVSDRSGSISFYETRFGNCGVGRVFEFGHSHNASPSYAVPTNTLDFYVSRLGMPSLVKMDIEGAEWLALNGADETLRRSDAPDFLIEFHPQEIQALSGSMESCLQKLVGYGFQRYRLNAAEAGSHTWFVFSKRVLDSPRLVLDR
jgi:FkbM family methyltransferase